MKKNKARTIPLVLLTFPAAQRSMRDVGVFRNTDLDTNVIIPEICLTYLGVDPVYQPSSPS